MKKYERTFVKITSISGNGNLNTEEYMKYLKVLEQHVLISLMISEKYFSKSYKEEAKNGKRRCQ